MEIRLTFGKYSSLQPGEASMEPSEGQSINLYKSYTYDVQADAAGCSQVQVFNGWLAFAKVGVAGSNPVSRSTRSKSF